MTRFAQERRFYGAEGDVRLNISLRADPTRPRPAIGAANDAQIPEPSAAPEESSHQKKAPRPKSPTPNKNPASKKLHAQKSPAPNKGPAPKTPLLP